MNKINVYFIIEFALKAIINYINRENYINALFSMQTSLIITLIYLTIWLKNHIWDDGLIKMLA